MRFVAIKVECEPGDEELVAYIFFRGDPSDFHYLALSRSLAPETDSRIAVEFDDQSVMCKGCITASRLDYGRLVLSLDPDSKVAGHLRDTVIEIGFDGSKEIERVRETLRVIFAGLAEYREGNTGDN